MSNYSPKKLEENEISIIAGLLSLPPKAFKPATYIGCLDRIKNEEDNLVLIHYNPDKIEELTAKEDIFTFQEIERISACRGFIIDLDKQKIVCRSYGYTINVPINNIPDEPYFIKTFGVELVIEPKDVDYKIYYGGTLIRIWFYHGKTMFSTHKKINAVNSHWGSSKTFLELFEGNQSTFRLNEVPIEEDLVHIFLINDESLLIDTRSKVVVNRIVYLETFNLVDITPGKRKFETELYTQLITEANVSSRQPIFFPEIIDRETANAWLTSGSLTPTNMPSSVWEGGEKVIVSYEGEVYTFMSDSAAWRRSLIDGKSNVYQIFCNLLNTKDHSKHLLPYAFSFDELTGIGGHLLSTGQLPEFLISHLSDFSSNDKYGIAIANLFFAAPIQRIPDILDIYNSFPQDILNAVEFLYQHKDELILLNNEGKINDFPSLHNKTSINKILSSAIPHILEKESRVFNAYNFNIANSWPSVLKDEFNKYYSSFKKTKSPFLISQIIIHAQILFYITNLYGDILYAFINLPVKYTKTQEARARTKALRDTVDTQVDTVQEIE